MRITVLTIFPEWFDGPLSTSLLGAARRDGLVEVDVRDLRDWADDPHRSVDDQPYGGGPGMVMRPEPIVAAVEELFGGLADRPRTVVPTPRGRRLDQPLLADLAGERGLLVICGRYEGIDERVHQTLADDEVSLGDYVLAGGELAAAAIVEGVSRLLPGVVGNPDSVADDSFAGSPELLEHPHYTRPAAYRGLTVPPALRSGDHGRIAAWRAEQARVRRRRLRPDLRRAEPPEA